MFFFSFEENHCNLLADAMVKALLNRAATGFNTLGSMFISTPFYVCLKRELAYLLTFLLLLRVKSANQSCDPDLLVQLPTLKLITLLCAYSRQLSDKN